MDDINDAVLVLYTKCWT